MNKISFLHMLFVLVFVLSGQSFANNKADMTLVKKEHDVLVSAQSAIDNDQLDDAITILEQFNKGSSSKLAKALSLQLLGNAYQTKEDYPLALKAYEAALSYNKLPLASKVALFEKAHKLSYFVKDWKKTVNWWLKWEKRAKPSAQDYLLLSSAYKHQEQWKKAKQALLKAMTLTDPIPKVWRQTLLSYEEKLGQPKQQIQMLLKMLELYPQTEEYWLKLADLYTKSNQSDKANALLYSAFSQGILTQKHHLYALVDNLAKNDSPMIAVQLLQESVELNYLVSTKEIDQLIIQLLVKAKAYQQALLLVNSRDVIGLLDNDKKDKHYQLLARLYFNLKQWQNAYNSALAISSEDLINSQSVQLLLGLSSAYRHNNDVAEIHFNNVLAIEPTNDVALYWHKKLME